MSERCQTTINSLGPYVDGELPPHEAAAVAEHLATCFACSAEYETVLETIGSLRARLERFTAPDVLRARIRTTIASTPSGDSTDRSETAVAPPARRGLRWTRIGSWAAALLVAGSLGSATTIVATRGRDPGDTPIASQVLASHVRSLMPDHLTDVRSSDQHNVKPWFNGRLDFSPAVPRLEEQGYPLLGGRLDYVGGRPVAVVVYGRRQHVINVFSWPSPGGDIPPEVSTKNGYTMIHWRGGGTEQWVLSDVNAAELQSFATLLRTK